MRPKFSKLWLVAVAALVFVSVLAAQSVEPPAINAPNHAEVQSGSAKDQPISNKPQQEQQVHALNGDAVAAADVETALRFNELRRELLDGRGKMVDRWLAATAIFLTLIGVGAAILGYFGFKKLDRIENEARKDMEAAKEHAEEAKSYVQQIRKSRDEASSLLKEINAEVAGKDPEKASKMIENVQQNSDSTLIDKAVAAAVSLQQQDKIEEAIEKWTSIANVSEEIDNDLAARAWFSVGFLISSNDTVPRKTEGRKNVDRKKAVEAYNKAIKLNPNNNEYYTNRGFLKFLLSEPRLAIADYNQALSINQNDAAAYYNRGIARAKLGRLVKARKDFIRAKNLYEKKGATGNDFANDAAIALEKLDKGEIP